MGRREGPVNLISRWISLGRGAASIAAVVAVWTAWLNQARVLQLVVQSPVAVAAASAPARERRRELPDRLWALPAEGLGRRSGPPQKAGVPEEVTFRTKPEIALDQIRAALEAGAPPGVVLMDAGYGADTRLRSALAETNPSPAVRPWSGRGRPTSRMVRDPHHQPQSVEGLSLSLPAEAWEMISWREGSADVLISRFARVRVRAAHRDFDRSVPRDEEWLLVEWPAEEEKPTKFWLGTVPEDVAFDRLVALAKLRWRIERDYQELKQELGLGHFEGRGWRGFHHHATLCIAAYAFLVAERAKIPPSEPTRLLATPSVPASSPRRPTADSTGASRRELNLHHAANADRRACPKARAMSVLHDRNTHVAHVVTQ